MRQVFLYLASDASSFTTGAGVFQVVLVFASSLTVSQISSLMAGTPLYEF
jgi:hypothetical protein